MFQGDTGAVGQVFILVKNQIPNFDPAVAVFFRRSGQTAPDFRAVIIKNFRAGTAGAGIAHLPEVIFGGDADNTVIGQAGNFFPDIPGFVVGVVNGNGQTVFGHVKVFGQQLPGKFNRVVFKIVAEGKIAEHFKKRMVTDVITDTVQVIVFPAGANGFLGSCGSLVRGGFVTGENIFELNHARVGKHQGRVVVGDERTGRNDFVSVLFKEV